MALENIKVNNQQVIGVDNEPIASSNNLVKSGGVAKFRAMDFTVNSDLEQFDKTSARMVKFADGTLEADGRYDIYSRKLTGLDFTEIIVQTATIYKIYASIAFYSNEMISAESYISGVLMEVDVVAAGNEKVGYYSAPIPSNAKLVVISNCNSGSLPTPSVGLFYNASILNSKIQDNKKYINLKEGLVKTQSISTIFKASSFVYSGNGFLNEGGSSSYDIYAYRSKGGEHIRAKVGMSNTPSVATVTMFSSPYWDSGRFSLFYLSDKTIANDQRGIIELDIDVPIGCHLVLISNNNVSLAVPQIDVYEKYVEEVKKTPIILSPLKNVFDKSYIVFDKHIKVVNDVWNIIDENGTAIAILELKGWGSDYIVIDGLGDTKDSRGAIFLDKNRNPNFDGASYSIPASLTSPRVFSLSRVYWNNNKYIAFLLWRYYDFGNQNPANGYVWSQKEINQGYPDWIDNIVVNFVNAPNVVPTLSEEAKEYCAGESYDKAKTEMFAKVSTELLANSYNPSKKFNFLFATDSHIDYNYPSKRNVEDMVEFANQNNIRQNLDCFIHNGDIATPGYVQDQWDKIDEGYEEFFDITDKIKVPFIQVSGNHDRHQEHNVPFAHAYTISKCVNLLKAHSKHSANTLYDYQDFTDKKIRIIKLDAFDYPLEDDGTSNHYVKYPLDNLDCIVSQTQMNWFVNTLLSTPSDYSIIVIGHIYAEKTILINPITQILSAVIDKSSGTASFDYSGIDISKKPYDSFNISYNFSTANNIDVVGIFGGHSHRDTYLKSNGINVFICGCQLFEDTTYANTEIIHKGAYTKYQNNFSAFTVDTVNNKLKLVRYGFGWPKGIPYDGNTEFEY